MEYVLPPSMDMCGHHTRLWRWPLVRLGKKKKKEGKKFELR